MLIIIGYIITIFCVLGGYAFSGGYLSALVAPYELMIIGGAALGSFIVSNNMRVIKASIRAVLSIFRGSSYSDKFYVELLSMFFELTNKIRKDGVLSIESDIDNYKESTLFSSYKLVQKEPLVMEFICDHLRLIVTGRVNATHLELLMDQDIETLESEYELPISAITKMADGMPAFGIVAAVMGVVMTMGKIGGPPEELGASVGHALVGTFLGILLGYCFIAPIASVLENRLRATITIFQSVKVALLASVHSMAPSIAVEFARKVLYSAERPTSHELEQILKDVKANKAQAGTDEQEQNATEKV